VLRARGTEDLDDRGQQTVGASTHVYGLDSQRCGIDAHRRSQSRMISKD
jgi:hypothetical protein